MISLWKVKSKMDRKRAFFVLPFITTLREGIEAMVFMGGVAISEAKTSIPLAAICGLLCGIFVGFLIYRGGNTISLQYFFVASTYLLLLIAAGLFSKGIFNFENNAWAQVIGSDPDDQTTTIPYNVKTAIWHVDCCDPENAANGGWTIFNAILGWNNTATIGSIVGYVGYWISVCVILVFLKLKDRRHAARQAKEDETEVATMWDGVLSETAMKKEIKPDVNVTSNEDMVQENMDEENVIELVKT